MFETIITNKEQMNGLERLALSIECDKYVCAMCGSLHGEDEMTTMDNVDVCYACLDRREVEYEDA